MPKHGKKYVEASKLIDRAAQYEVSEAIELAKKTATAKFDETVEVAFRLGVDPRLVSYTHLDVYKRQVASSKVCQKIILK